MTWTDVTSYLSNATVELGDISALGTGSSGVDGVVRTLDFTLRQDRVFLPAWPDTVAADELYVVGDDVTTVVGDENDGGEVLINLLFGVDNTLAGSESFAPRDRESSWNQFSGAYSPLLWPNRETILRVALEGNQQSGTTSRIGEAVGTGDGTTVTFSLDYKPVLVSPTDGTKLKGTVYLNGSPTTAYTVNADAGTITFTTAPGVGVAITADYTYYYTLFHGYLGDNIKTSGPTVDCSCRDLSKRLQDRYIEQVREYGSAAGVAAETVIQQILDDNLGAGVVTLYTPVSPGFMIRPYKAEYADVWSKIQEVPAQIGWFLGYRWDAATSQFRLTLMEPPRSKNASTADFALTWEDDIYTHDLGISDQDVRNVITVWYRDKDTGQRASVNVEDAASIAEYGRRAMTIEEADTSLIDTAAEATDFANAAKADLKDLTATSRLDMPLLPQMDVFSGVTVDDPRVSSTIDFYGVESVRHDLNWESGRFRTEVVGSGRVIGAHTRWLAMQTRPGSGLPVSGREIVSNATPAAPTGLSVASSGLEQVGQTTMAYVVLSWVRPTGYYPDRYRLQVQRNGGAWTQVQEYVLPELSQRIILPGNVGYDARVAAITKESVQGAWSSTLVFTTPADGTAPATPTGLTVVASIRGLTVTLTANTEADWDGFEIHASTTTGFTPDATTLKAKGRATRYDLIDLTPGTTYFVKAIAYDTSNNKSAATTQASGVAGQASTGDLADDAVSQKATVNLTETSLITTTSTSYVEVTDLTSTIISSVPAKLLVLFRSNVNNGTPDRDVFTQLQVNGVDYYESRVTSSTQNSTGNNTNMVMLDVAVGTHTIKVLWKVSSGSTGLMYTRQLIALLLKR